MNPDSTPLRAKLHIQIFNELGSLLTLAGVGNANDLCLRNLRNKTYSTPLSTGVSSHDCTWLTA